MKLDLEKGVFISVEGELGRYHTLPIDTLVEIGTNLQALVQSIAKYDNPVDTAIDLDNFKIELSGFKKGSAVPVFVLTPRVQLTVSDIKSQREILSKKFGEILELADSGKYIKLKDMYPDYVRRNEIVDHLYNFTSSFKDSPVSIGSGMKTGTKYAYKIRKFSREARNELFVEVKEKGPITIENAVARVKIMKEGKKQMKRIEEVFSQEKHSLSYSPEAIKINGHTYMLNFPLRCLLEKEEDYYVIKHEPLDLIGTGKTQDEAENNFNEEFDFLYQRLFSLSDHQLTKRLQGIKLVLNHFVKNMAQTDGH